jgi:hypothetical protein
MLDIFRSIPGSSLRSIERRCSRTWRSHRPAVAAVVGVVDFAVGAVVGVFTFAIVVGGVGRGGSSAAY